MRKIAFLIVLLTAPYCFAWNKPGHMIVAAIAYDVLAKDHPQTVQKFIAIMHAHPEWEKFNGIIHAESIPDDARDRYLFMVAARWPDDVRNEAGGYSHAPWHYIDEPIVFPKDEGKVTPQPPDRENALTAFDAQTKVIKNGTDQSRQAIALCWIAHLTGDLHQPLHCCSEYTTQNPKGDRGGNSDIVRVEDGRAPINLHALWDDFMTTSTRYQASAKIAADLRSRPEFAREKLPNVGDAKPSDWAQESFGIAKHSAYLDGSLTFGSDPKDRAAPVLPKGYVQDAKAVAEQRIILAGYRLADQLVADLGG